MENFLDECFKCKYNVYNYISQEYKTSRKVNGGDYIMFVCILKECEEITIGLQGNIIILCSQLCFCCCMHNLIVGYENILKLLYISIHRFDIIYGYVHIINHLYLSSTGIVEPTL